MSCRIASRRERDAGGKEEEEGAGGPVVYIFKTPGEAALTSNDYDGENVDEERRMVRQSSGIY